LDAADDAAVWRLDDKRSLVITTDFFTPVVDDPYDYGAIAAANSLSDVYAMGGVPVLALNVACLPPSLPLDMAQSIIRGAAEKAKEAGVVVAGGHSVVDDEPKFGLVVIGFVEQDRILTKGGANPGDHLFLTKPLGIGVTTTALKRGMASQAEISEAVNWMKQLNEPPAHLAHDLGLRSATDITGFGLLGHASEIARASGVGLDFYFSQLPLTSGALRLAEAFTFPGGASNNKLYFEDQVVFDSDLSENLRMLLFDPQTSGGLLMCVSEDKLADFQQKTQERGISAWDIGTVSPNPDLRVHM